MWVLMPLPCLRCGRRCRRRARAASRRSRSSIRRCAPRSRSAAACRHSRAGLGGRHSRLGPRPKAWELPLALARGGPGPQKPPRGRERGATPRLTDLSPFPWPCADSRRFSWPRRYLKEREAADEAAAKLERLENTPEGKSSGLLGGASNKSRELKKQREKSDGAAARVIRKSPAPARKRLPGSPCRCRLLHTHTRT